MPSKRVCSMQLSYLVSYSCACASAGLSVLVLFACGLKLLLYIYHGHSKHLGLVLKIAGEILL